MNRHLAESAAGITGTPGGGAPTSTPRRVEFWGDSPTPTVVVPLAFAVVRDSASRVLLARRADTGNWELPGGRIEPGETVTDAVRREVDEETGVTIVVTGLAGVFCDPSHVVVYPGSGEARQQHVTLVHAVPAEPTTAGQVADGRSLLVPDQTETDAAAWVELGDLAALPVHPSVHRRLEHALRHHRGHADAHLE